MAYSNQLRKKVKNQLDLIRNRIGQLRQKIPIFIQFLKHQIPLYAEKIRAPGKEPRVDYSKIPEPIAASIISSGLDRRMWMLNTLKFELDSGFCNELESFEDRLYDILNYIVYAVRLVHPNVSVGDRFESLVKNVAILGGVIGPAITAAESWVKEFKQQRRITAHRSPIDLCTAKVRAPLCRCY